MVLFLYISPLARPLLSCSTTYGDSSLPSHRVTLGAAIIVALLIWLLIYYSPLNPSGELVGVDPTHYYIRWVSEVLDRGPYYVLKYGDRPLYILTLYLIAIATDPLSAMKLALLLCMLLYTIATYLLVSVLAGRKLGGIAALLSVSSYTTTAGVFAGYYANWTAASLMLLAMATVIKWGERPKYWLLVALLVIAATAIHTYITLVSVATLILMEVIRSLATGSSRKRLILIILILASYLATLKTMDLIAVSAGFNAKATTGIEGVARIWLAPNMIFTVEWWGKHLFAVYNYMASASIEPFEWLLIILTAMTVKRLQAFLVMSWLATSGILLFTAPTSGLMHRSLYALPIPALESLSLPLLTSHTPGKSMRRLLLFLLFTYRLNYALSFLIGLRL